MKFSEALEAMMDGKEIGIHESTRTTRLNRAVRDKDIVRVQELISKKVDVNALDKRGDSALHYAANHYTSFIGGQISDDDCGASIEITKLLLAANANINIQNLWRITPLMLAVTRGNLGLVELLLVNGANVNTLDKNGRTALFHAIDDGQIHDLEYDWYEEEYIYTEDYCMVKIAKLLLDYGAKINIRDINGLTVSQYSKKGCNVRVLHKILKDLKRN